MNEQRILLYNGRFPSGFMVWLSVVLVGCFVFLILPITPACYVVPRLGGWWARFNGDESLWYAELRIARPCRDHDMETLHDNALPLGFAFRRSISSESFLPGTGSYLWIVQIPYWFIIGIIGVSPAMWFTRRQKAKGRVHAGACIECGYDLRCSPDRCPECGKPVLPNETAAMILRSSATDRAAYVSVVVLLIVSLLIVICYLLRGRYM